MSLKKLFQSKAVQTGALIGAVVLPLGLLKESMGTDISPIIYGAGVLIGALGGGAVGVLIDDLDPLPGSHPQ